MFSPMKRSGCYRLHSKVMAHKITTEIPVAAFERIRDRMFEILVEEFAGQVLLGYDPELEVNVYKERSNAIDKTETSAIVVGLAKGNWSNKHQGSQDGAYQFFVDHFTKSKSNSEGDGDTLSALKLQKIMRVTRAILEDPIYKTLGYAPLPVPFIMKTYFSTLDIADGNNRDANNIEMGRLVFNVVANETSKLIDPPLIAGYKTTVKMDGTGKGFLFPTA